MRRSTNRRAASRGRFDRRLIAAAGALVVFGAIIGVSQISSADTNSSNSTKAIRINGLDVLANTCDDSNLEDHTGFQLGNRCVSTEFGEVASAANNASLLIVQSPRQVNVNTPFQLRVSTRGVKRDRFLAAGAGGYYVESSLLQGDGIVRGHFHTACRMLGNTNQAPDPAPVPAFFVATEDGNGSKAPDTVTINVPGLPAAGTAQCASWAGDGSHRVPMSERANQTPAFDAVRIQVRNGGGGNNNGGNNNGAGGNNGGGQNNNGGQQGGNNNAGQPPQPPAQAPAQAPVKGTPDTKDSTVKPAPSSTTKPQPTKPQPTKSQSQSTTATSSNDDDEEAAAEAVTQKTATKQTGSTTTKKKVAVAQATENDGGYTLDENAQPDPRSADVAASKVATKSQSFDLTSTNTVAIAGFSAILLTLGFAIYAMTRRRTTGTYYN